MLSSSEKGLRRWTRHTPWVGGPAVAALTAADTAVWGAAGPVAGATAGAAAALGVGVPVAGRTTAQWAGVYWRHRFASYPASAPATVNNDRTGGGVRYQDGTVITAIHVLGRYLSPTLLTGATSHTDNVLRVGDLAALMNQFLDLKISSLSVVTMGSRVRVGGDYAPIYHSFIGPPPYAGQREQWLIVRIATDHANVNAVSMRSSAGVAALAATQRIVNALRTQGIRARVGTPTDITGLEGRLGGRHVLQRHNRRWRAVRSEVGWLTSFYYPPEHINTADLSGIWSRREDLVIQNVTLYPDGRCTATATIGDPQITALPPSVALASLPGEQAAAVAACRPLPPQQVGGAAAVAAGPPDLELPIRDSGVLFGQLDDGRRLVLPFTDPDVSPLRIRIRADDSLAKRLIMRAAGAGERVTIHTESRGRWQAMAMPGIIVTSDTKPVSGTTISVTDSGRMPSPSPATIICLTGEKAAHMVIEQIGPARLSVKIAKDDHENDNSKDDADLKKTPDWEVEMDLFADERPYLHHLSEPPDEPTTRLRHADTPTTRLRHVDGPTVVVR